MEQKTTTWEEIKEERLKKLEELRAIPLTKRLPPLVEKMINIVRGDTGGSVVYADMLLSMLPNSEYRVNIGYWCYKADSDDFQTMLDLMQERSGDAIWEYEALVKPYEDELLRYLV